MDNIFTALERDYDAYEDDIAILNVYFDTSSVMQFGTQASQGISNFTNPKVDFSSKLGSFANKKYFYSFAKLTSFLNNLFVKIDSRLDRFLLQRRRPSRPLHRPQHCDHHRTRLALLSADRQRDEASAVHIKTFVNCLELKDL